MTRDLLWLNGRTMPIEDGRISIEDRGFNFSDGIYEVCRFYGGRPFMLREHLERWEFSARGLMMEMPGTLEERAALILDLVEQSGHRDAMVYGQLTRGTSTRNHLFPPASVPPNELWFVRPAPQHDAAHYHNGVKLVSHPDERWKHCQYKTISLLPNVLAKERARREGGYEALLFNERGIVTECSASNAYCIRGGTLYTHPLAPEILGGITRQAIFAAADAEGIPVAEQAQTLEQFKSADEVFISSTTMELMPVTQIDDVRVGDGRVGPLTQRLHAAFRERVARECGTGAAV